MNASDIIFYTTPQGEVRIEVYFEEETFWLSQKKMAELFDVEVNTINYHLKEIFQTAELEEERVIRILRITAADGKSYNTNHYNLDAIIAVGYRVNSARATKFRIWSTNTLKEFIIKGFVLDDARMKQGKRFGQDYFEELLERIREIRASEAVVKAVTDAGWNVLYMAPPDQKPFEVSIYRGEERHRLRIYVWNLTPGGRGRDPDEYRIQITGFTQFENHPPERTLILGWWEEAGVFAGWDFSKHAGTLGGSPSFQIKEQNLREAHLNGFSPYTKGNGEVAIGFRPDFFVTYVQHLEQLHGFGGSVSDFKALEALARQPVELNAIPLEQVSSQRKTAIIQLNKKLRDSSFKARVLTAYGHQCAFSGVRLKLADAAHIIPVSSDLSNDATANGIALSALYHRAYDRGLVTFDEEYRIVINDKEVVKLQELGFDGGIEGFKNGLRPIIHVPPAVSDRPNVEMVKEANRLRGWA